MKTSTWSLSRRLTLCIMAFQALTLLALASYALAVFFKADSDGVVIHPQLTSSIAASVHRDGPGSVSLRPTAQLRDFMSSSPNLWIIVKESDGGELNYGPVPEATSSMLAALDDLKTIDIRGSETSTYLTSRLEAFDSAAGRVTIWTGGGAFISDAQAILLLGGIFTAIPIIVLLTLTAIGLPLVVRFSLKSIRELSAQIATVDYQARGRQIEVSRLPLEIYPMVRGLNDAFRRIDEGAEATERFFVNAAHELRTPVAILQVRVAGLEPGPETEKIKLVVRRLAALANQLLAIETLRQSPNERRRLNLGEVVAEAVGDLAPYAVAEGYTISLDAPEVPVWTMGDRAALDRLFVNLIQNAIQHGGKSGAISIRLSEQGTVEVEDEGPGIAEDKRERIFDAFYRINGHGGGSGLGLKIVRDIAREHGGDVTLQATGGAGSKFRVYLPYDGQPASRQTPGIF
ncbi:HAMP domain-containing sensor histidine kinase [Agrobacterium sp. CCNWLW71]|uniref:sensor histidine kinase n=1 Tax=unclassified Agrobacterium TaxID=2632611 RepID=UPI002FF09394